MEKKQNFDTEQYLNEKYGLGYERCNGLLATFMGAKAEQWYPENSKISQTGIHYDFSGSTYPDGQRYWGDYALLYHKDWDWLIPVYNKIAEDSEKNGYLSKILDPQSIKNTYLNIFDFVIEKGYVSLDDAYKLLTEKT